ncbi:hypothetical protein [Gloeobacter kilaueensis]|uniref:Uncharacterized protein n=1 Tax=Gloeobacter kilaueensis (strain ATCC BAA-2537 / CCAP 1431/1 / ULC 316 / JS1) TaxID=1183438 RepID=U5QJC9_GLOK1|nr:hypothetical protein [Gloeobacter kilaueensis]AGY58973.1 hypothetical protein GKIL_2727 [Gloeobacter kilaueensis JS1]
METLIYGSYVVAIGGAIRAVDGRFLNALALLPDDQYRPLIGWLLAVIYLCLGWAYIELVHVFDAPAIGISVGWIGMSWYLIDRHLKSPDAQDHAYAWVGNHLLLSGAFFLLLWLERSLIEGRLIA